MARVVWRFIILTKTGAIIVMSGRWLPPSKGSLTITTSPSATWGNAQDRVDAGRHGAEMRRDVRCLRDQVALCIEDRTRKVESLLDVGRVGVRRSVTPISSATPARRWR
jgi:hypothetical protein